jgi:hypothetical protein
MDITGLNSLTQYYDVAPSRTVDHTTKQIVDVPGHYILTCKQCRTEWVVRRLGSGHFRPGDILHLLDHALAHKEKGTKHDAAGD